MPNTLKHVARKSKIKRQVSWLTQKPAYNAKIGSAYIGDRHDEFGGSYIMTFAGFNAGPGRVRQWVRQFGDPRSKEIDPIDWVERIPFKETRNYVQKVLANVQIYRARLTDGQSEIKTYQDLHRGRF
jgi:soluble lytic murein transglycosylase